MDFTLKQLFIDGNPYFMSAISLCFVLGLAFCIERFIYLKKASVNTKKLLAEIEQHVEKGNVNAAKELCRNTYGPVASICYQGLLRINESLENAERSIAQYGAVQAANLDKGCSWISLFITIAPSIGFLGTVAGMMFTFSDIQNAGDISPTIVASGMKVALITTIYGIVVAVFLQVLYNFILSRIDRLVSQMEESAITLMDIIAKTK
ncbi:MAG: MotA/TolQ/ExbB proton channel family protein [Bacteroidaceae bacterium]|nr:MotA/TolQ/ExbB proton channel family protein [Bacteroidaceae bacterium]